MASRSAGRTASSREKELTPKTLVAADMASVAAATLSVADAIASVTDTVTNNRLHLSRIFT